MKFKLVMSDWLKSSVDSEAKQYGQNTSFVLKCRSLETEIITAKDEYEARDIFEKILNNLNLSRTMINNRTGFKIIKI